MVANIAKIFTFLHSILEEIPKEYYGSERWYSPSVSVSILNYKRVLVLLHLYDLMHLMALMHVVVDDGIG
jgi:hypothetical protein